MKEKSKTLQLRFIRPEDREAVLKMEAAAHRFGKRADPRALDRAGLDKVVERPRSRAYVAAADDKVVGYLLLDVGTEDCVVLRLTADPRRRGYGTALLRQAEAAAAKAGCARVVAYAYEEDLAAHQFLKARGYKGAPERKCPEWDGPGIKFTKAVG